MQDRTNLLNRMSIDLGASFESLEQIIRTAPLRYKVFYIPKRDGSLREVAQPAREVKAIQRWIIHDLERLLPVHSAATAYRTGSSIKKNAMAHVESNYMLKMDLRNFFPSILFSDVVKHLGAFAKHEYADSAINLIARACTWAPKRSPPLRLCIGAPSSPFLSNSIMFDFDNALQNQVDIESVRYTRYADDLTLSCASPGVLEKYPSVIERILSSLEFPRLEVNERKTVLASRAAGRFVTGVILTPDFNLSVGRDRKRLIRSMYHKMTLGLLSQVEINKLNGLLSFVEDIEPGFLDKIRSKYNPD